MLPVDADCIVAVDDLGRCTVDAELERRRGALLNNNNALGSK